MGDIVQPAERQLISRWWKDYAGDQEPSNTLLREFYINVVRPSDLYYYGIVFEVFDLLVNEVFDPFPSSKQLSAPSASTAETTVTPAVLPSAAAGLAVITNGGSQDQAA